MLFYTLTVDVTKRLSSEEMETVSRVQILDEADCVSDCTNALMLSANRSDVGLFSLSKATDKKTKTNKTSVFKSAYSA